MPSPLASAAAASVRGLSIPGGIVLLGISEVALDGSYLPQLGSRQGGKIVGTDSSTSSSSDAQYLAGALEVNFYAYSGYSAPSDSSVVVPEQLVIIICAVCGLGMSSLVLALWQRWRILRQMQARRLRATPSALPPRKLPSYLHPNIRRIFSTRCPLPFPALLPLSLPPGSRL